MVYILNKDGNPLMPTERHGKVRRLLKSGQAKVVNRTPFTIQLLYETGNETQTITLVVDAGSKVVGLSATTDTKELYAAECSLRTDIVELLSERRQYRTVRRNRKTRYRKPRFKNRRRKEGWLAPSIEQKTATHLKLMADLHKILPITSIIVEVAQFDIQKIKNPGIFGVDYQQGEQLDFWNIREYVLFRDGHKCQHCKGKNKDRILNVHHIESRKTGGDAPNNLITLCETCHNAYHAGQLGEAVFKRNNSFRDAAFMGIMRWTFYERLKEEYPDVSLTYGYMTKQARIQADLVKTHAVDAHCISGNLTAVPTINIYIQRNIRSRNRQLHKATINKGGYRKAAQTQKVLYGFRLYDKVSFIKSSIEYTGFIGGRRQRGSFLITGVQGDKLTEITYKKLKLLEQRRSILIDCV